MKKTVLGILTVVMLLVVMLSTSVNAATLSADKETMEKGDIVTVTVTTDEEVESMQFDLKFDTAKYKFVENSVSTALRTLDYNVNGDTITVSAFDTSLTATTLTLQFEALANGENVAFEISGEEFSNDETLANSKVEVTIEEELVTPPVEPEEPTEPEQPVEPSEPSEDEKEPVKDNEDKYIDDDGNEITSLPQAGTIIPSIVLGIAMITVVAVVGYKTIKK